ncbi:MAG TPA: alpha-glycosidase [Ktedonobacter sp.]|nr:alpha-glycosidase [Ktedonobacter sp.]
MNIEAIYHHPYGAYAYVNGPDTLRVRLRTSARDSVQCFARWNDRCSSPDCQERVTPMTWLASDGLFHYWEAELHEPYRRLRYAFQIRDASEEVWYTEDGYSHTPSQGGWLSGFFNWPYLYQSQRIQVPGWVRDAVFYEIFPERFANGDSSNDHPAVKEWSGKPEWFNFWGGDLAGIQQHLSYLQSLGVNALWLTPIFASPSNHKYDITDYTKIDPYFGSEDSFRKLLEDCHARGMRVILDAVYNHCSTDFFAWQDVVANGETSRYSEWFHVLDMPPDWRKRNYRMFDHHGHMPKLNTYHPEVQRYLIDAAAKWTRMGVDGWRLDVAGEVDPSLWRAFRRELRAINPDIYIVGEVEHEAARWTLGDMFDGVQHYPLYRAALGYFAAGADTPTFGTGSSEPWDTTTFDRRLGQIRSWYPTPVLSALLAPLSTHDTPRFLTMCGGDTRKLRLAVTFLLTYCGTPMIYYGDEVGMVGGPDPDCRRPMLWDPAQQDQELLAYYRHVIALRHKHAALRTDGVWTCLAQNEPNIYAYLRGELPMGNTPPSSDVALIVLNNSPTSQQIDVPLQATGRSPHALQSCWPDGTLLHDDLAGQVYTVTHGKVTVRLAAYEGAIITSRIEQ